MNITILQPPQTQSHRPMAEIGAVLADALGAYPVQVAAGERLYSVDSSEDRVYAIRSGQLDVRNREGLRLQRLAAGTCVGALEVWTGRTWGLEVTAASDCELIAIAAYAFRDLMRIHSALRQAVGEQATRLMRQVQLAEVLKLCLGALDSDLLDLITTGARWRHLKRGESLLRQGEPVDQLFLVVNGRLHRLYRGADGVERMVGSVGPAEVLGSFFGSSPQPVTALAVRETAVIELPTPLCRQLLETFPQAILPLVRQSASQQGAILAALDARPQPPTTLALIPASAAVDIGAFVASLATAMQPYGPVLTLTRSAVDAHFGQKRVADIPAHHPLHAVLVDWLNQLEAGHQHILYVGEPAWSEWTQRCLHQADRILVVANSQDDPAPTLVERAVYAYATDAPVELVLLHAPTVAQPHGTADWLAQRPVRTHYHIRQNDGAHSARLARRLTGNAIGLVLSGGGARGYIHLGLLRALEELAFPYDLVGGTSMGALGGAVFALGWDYAQARARTVQFGNPRALFDYTLPLVSLFASDKVTGMIRTLVGEQQIEDLWQPYFAVSTDLTAAQPVVHEHGPLWQAVRASLSIPGIFAPVIDEAGHLLVDGGVMNNLPADIMRARIGSGKVIGMNAGHAEEPEKPYNYGPSISGWLVLRSRLHPHAERIEAPMLSEVLVRTMMVNNQQVVRKTRQECDLLIEPAVQSFGLLKFAEYEAIADLGYRAAKAALAQFKR
jgi:predicted acylesterase/phospholipase RssA/CRP-like cAMP-binding protein